MAVVKELLIGPWMRYKTKMASQVLSSSFLYVWCVKSVFTRKTVCHMSTRVADLMTQKPIGSQTSIKGWVKAIRKMKTSVFVDVNDGSCPEHIQVFIPKSKTPNNLTCGSAIEALGQIQETNKGQLELTAESVIVVGTCVVADGYPLTPRQTITPDYLRQFLHLRPRNNTFASLLRVRDAAAQAFHKYFQDCGYVSVHTPILTSNDCEGAGEVFAVKPESESLIKSMAKEGVSTDETYFDTKAYLTVSGQMHLETVVRALSKVYTFGPTFRAENSKTRHHLSEFYMIEAEVAFVNSLEEITAVMERMIKCVTRQVLDRCEQDVAIVQGSNGASVSLAQVTEKPFTVMTYEEAVGIVDKHSRDFSTRFEHGQGFGKEHELFLVKYNQGVPIFLVDWPCKLKPFYMKQMNADPKKVAAVDLLTPEVGELCGGSLREDDFSTLETKLIEVGLETTLAWYLQLRKYGNVPTGGFGMGFERYLQLLLGIANIKDTIPFPRWPHNCKM